jgi:hypothetical protein
MRLQEGTDAGDDLGTSFKARSGVEEGWIFPRVQAEIVHLRDGKELSREVSRNVKTNVGIDFLHTQGYGTSPAGNGLNQIALSNDTVTETATSTTLSNEITTNGLARAQGAVAHTAGTTTTTIMFTFTATGSQSAQKAALFTAPSGGTINHILGFSQRSLLTGDQLAITFSITLG